jgi:hypothetical protein
MDTQALNSILQSLGSNLVVNDEVINLKFRCGLIDVTRHECDAKTLLRYLLLLQMHMRFTNNQYMEYEVNIPFLNKNPFENPELLASYLVKEKLEL